MHDFVVKEIRSLFSSYDGWTMTERDCGDGYDRIVLLERRNNGHRECQKVLVTFSRVVPSPELETLLKPETSSDGTLTRNGYAILAPASADTSAVPAGVRVHTMRSFTFDGKELAWNKKPVRKEEAAPAAS